MDGKCIRCLSTKHQVSACTEPIRCWFRMNSGHLASNCRKRPGYKTPLNPPVLSTANFPELAPLHFPPKSLSAPSAMDDLTARPLLDSVVISATGEIERRRERFSARSLVAWQVGALGDKVEIGVFADDMRSAFHIRRADIQFTKFHAEDFFITCSNQSDRDAILRQPRLSTSSGRVYLFRPWDESLHGIQSRYRYRARLCIEGIPMHGRTDEAAAKVIGRKCAIHYVEEYSRRGNYSRTYDMWVWTDEPRAIPRGGSFAITDADEEGLPTDIPLPEMDPLRNPPPSEPKNGWTYNVLVHVDTLEDLHTRKARAYKWDYEV